MPPRRRSRHTLRGRNDSIAPWRLCTKALLASARMGSTAVRNAASVASDATRAASAWCAAWTTAPRARSVSAKVAGPMPFGARSSGRRALAARTAWSVAIHSRPAWRMRRACRLRSAVTRLWRAHEASREAFAVRRQRASPATV